MVTFIHELRTMPIHILVAGIVLANETGANLHQKREVKKIGLFKEVRIKCDEKNDVDYWLLIL